MTIDEVRRRDRLYFRAEKCLTYAMPVSFLVELFGAYTTASGNYRLFATILLYASGIAIILHVCVPANLRRLQERTAQQLLLDQETTDQYLTGKRFWRRREIFWAIQVLGVGTTSLSMFMSHAPAFWPR